MVEIVQSIVRGWLARRRLAQEKSKRVAATIKFTPATVSLRPGGNAGGARFASLVTATPAAGTTIQPYSVGTRVQAKYSDGSKKWKNAVITNVDDSRRTASVRFDGFSDITEIPFERIKAHDPRPAAIAKKPADRPRKPPWAVPVINPDAWRPHRTAPMAPNDELLGKARTILSKLAPANFDRLAEHFLALPVDTPATLSALCDLMFERAVAETAFCSIYAALFSRCAEHLKVAAEPVDGEEGVEATPMPKSTTTTFRSVLLNRAQAEFESPPEQGDRKRRLGFFVFLGELWCKGLLLDKHVHLCVGRLLESAAEAEELALELVEAACTLLKTIGATLDATEKGRARLDGYMSHVTAWSKDKSKVPSARMRFKLMDLADARKKGWKLEGVTTAGM